jgi:hypothetical protein
MTVYSSSASSIDVASTERSVRGGLIDLFPMVEMIREIAAKTARYDAEDFMIDDYAGGNIDDAFRMGQEDGEILFARRLLTLIGS